MSRSDPGRPGRRRELLHLAGACLVLVLGVWASSGTLAPYATTLSNPFVWESCNYLLNIDHFHFKAVFSMLDGAPRDQWEYSVVLRRILHPLLAYPLMKVLGFGAGGIVANVLLAVGSLVFFWRALQRRYGSDVPFVGLWLLATYPGFFYWAGLPYSYGVIVPLSLIGLTVLWRVSEISSSAGALLCGLVLGLFSTGYDLLPFFGVAGVLILLYRRLWLPCAAFAAGLIIPPAGVILVEKALFQIPFRNANTEAYGIILRSYLSPWSLSPEELARWRDLLAGLPRIALDVFLFSNFLVLPLLFLLCLLASLRLPPGQRAPSLAGVCLLAAAALLFLFNNAAPPYPGWQLRGSWLARIYQPAGVAMIAYVAVFYTRARLLPPRLRGALWGAALLAIAANAWIVFGPVLGSTGLSQIVYHRFYRHDRPTAYSETLSRFGARPLGFCRGGPVPSAPTAQATVRH